MAHVAACEPARLGERAEAAFRNQATAREDIGLDEVAAPGIAFEQRIVDQYILNRRLAAGAQQPRDRVEIGGPIGFADRLDHFDAGDRVIGRSEEHTSELQSLIRISYADFCLKKKKRQTTDKSTNSY